MPTLTNKKNSSKGSGRAMPIPLEPLKEGHRIDPQERFFLDAAEKGDKHTMIRCLQGPNPVNVNCTNMLGRSAIQIAVDNENNEIVELLLKQEGVKIGDALLYAIREGVYKIVEMLIDHPTITRGMLGSEWSKTKHGNDESSDYSPDICPVILAAHCNQFEILQLLLLRGATIDRPHELSCSCKKCQEQVHEDSLRHSLLRINAYRALASPAWISLTSPDPILAAFKLSWELEKLALKENEFKDTYMELAMQCKRYACDLLDQCRSSEEVIAVLNKNLDLEESNDDECSDSGEKLTLSRLKLALKYEQKQFVAHPHCQQLLTSIWYEGLPGWRKRNGITKFLICIGLICLLPFMAVYYWIFPRSKIGQILRSPFMKFLYHSVSFGAFLSLLICASTEVSSQPGREKVRGPPPSMLEWLIVFWVTGFIWAECKQLWEEGLKAYVRQWWNWLDFLMLSLYLATFSLRIVSYAQVESGKYGPREMGRNHWPQNDPTLISEGLFAVANVFSFSRIIYLFQANQHLGPLQISLGCMLIDIAKFLFIFFLVLTSFACGLNQLYWYYNPSSTRNNEAFYTLGASYVTLFWSLFSLTQLKDIQLEEGQDFTEMMGEILFMAYHAMAIIVLINMLIAMMSNSYQEIENHADMEWKFARSKLWMGYFDEGSTLPPPFNLIISPKSIYYVLRKIKHLLCLCVSHKRQRKSHRKSGEGMIKIPLLEGHLFTKLPQEVLLSLQNKPRFLPKSVPKVNGNAAMHPNDVTAIFLYEVVPSGGNFFGLCRLMKRPDHCGSTRSDQLLLMYQSDVQEMDLKTQKKQLKHFVAAMRTTTEKNNMHKMQTGNSDADLLVQAMRGRRELQRPIRDFLSLMSAASEDIMRRLVSRYIHQIKKQLRQDGVNEDDLLEIKQDISSLRYELREDRKREAARASGHMDTLKRDIIHTLRGHSPNSSPLLSHMDKVQHGGNPMLSSSFSLISHHDLEQLKRDIVSSLKVEIRGAVSEVLQNSTTNNNIPPMMLPSMNSELYHTHLYTQL